MLPLSCPQTHSLVHQDLACIRRWILQPLENQHCYTAATSLQRMSAEHKDLSAGPVPDMAPCPEYQAAMSEWQLLVVYLCPGSKAG